MNPIEKVANGMTYGGSGTALWFGLTANEWMALGGFIVAVVGLLVTWHYQRKRDRREQAEFDRRMGLHE
jgi:hypothetical protein